MKTWLRSIVFRYRGPLALLIALQLGCGLLVSIQPHFYQQLISLVVNPLTTSLWDSGLPLLLTLTGIYLALAAIQAAGGYVGTAFSSDLLRHLQTDFFETASRLPLHYFQHHSAGEFFTRFNSDIGQAQRFLADLLPGIVRETITAAAVTGILFYSCSVPLTLAALGLVAATGILVAVLNGIMGRYAAAQRTGWSEINRVFDETVQGIDTLKLLAAEGRQSAHFQQHAAVLQQLSKQAGTLLSVFSPGIELLSRLGGLGLVAMAYYLIAKGEILLDPFLLFFFYATLLQMSIANLTRLLATVQTEFTGIRHLAAFFTERPETEEHGATVQLPTQSREITFSGLTFGYPGGRRLYHRAHLVIPANAITLIRGQSGSGKSTLINLLLRFTCPQEGVIAIGGTDIRQISRSELRRQIGVITQHHFIFEGTLRDNLAVGQPEATDAEMLHALERAQLGKFLAGLPHGLDSLMDPRGMGMSAGESQRICIARVLLRKAPFMVLDEPWSNLDAEARARLAEVINAGRAGATIMVLTHDAHPTLVVDRQYHLDGENGIFMEENPAMPWDEAAKRPVSVGRGVDKGESNGR